MCARQVASHLHPCSVGLTDLSLKTNTMSILQLAFPDWIAIINMLLVMSPYSLLSLLILFTKLIPSITHADGIDSTDATLPSICRTRNNLFIFLRVDSA